MTLELDHSEIRELDHRRGDGFEVSLLWSSRTGRIFVTVEDARTNDGFHIAVDPRDALDAFRHPYAYSRRRRCLARGRPGRDAAPAQPEFG